MSDIPLTLCSSVITQCAMQVLYDAGKEGQEVVDLAKRFERRKCNHREPIANDACLTDVIGAFDLLQLLFGDPSPRVRGQSIFEADTILLRLGLDGLGSSGPENKHRYVLATQSVPLRNHMRSNVPALPVMHIKRGVTVLEPMSDMSVRKKAQVRFALRPPPPPSALRQHCANFTDTPSFID